MPTKKLQSIAYHEAGHAAIALRLGVKVNTISIVPDDESEGRVSHANVLRGIDIEIDGSDRARVRCEKLIQVCFAGPIAQRQFNPNGFRKYHCASDFDQSVDLLFRISGSSEIVSAYNKLLWLQTQALVRTLWPDISALAEELLSRGHLTRSEIGEVRKTALLQRARAWDGS